MGELGRNGMNSQTLLKRNFTQKGKFRSFAPFKFWYIIFLGEGVGIWF